MGNDGKLKQSDRNCRTEKSGILGRTLRYMFAYKYHISITLILTIIVSSLSIARPWIQKLLIDNVFYGAQEQELYRVIVLLVSIAFIQVICRITRRYFFARIQESCAMDIRSDISNWLFGLKYKYTSSNDTGTIISSLMQDVDSMSNIYGPIVVSLLTDAMQFIVTIGIMIYISGKLTLIVIPLFVAMMYAMKDATKPIQNASSKVQDAKAKCSSAVKEFWSSLAETKTLDARNIVIDRLTVAFNSLMQGNVKLATIQALFQSVDLFIWLVTAVMLWVGGMEVIAGNLTMGDIIAYWGYMALILGPINNFVNSIGTGRVSLGAAERVFGILDSGEPEEGTMDTVEFPDKFEYIIFRNVGFKYETSSEVICQFECRIKAGEKVAIVGESGRGKTTLVSLLTGLYDTTEGELLINEIPIETIKRSSLRRNIAMVHQYPYIFKGTIKENILIANPSASDEEAISAAKKAGILSYINDLDDGMDTIVGDGSKDLSGGQKQRVALARVFVRNPSIVILDEFTSALDSAMESQVLESIMNEYEHATVIAISHRESTISALDRVIHL